MGRRKVIEVYYQDICNISDTLVKLVSSYRLLIGGAEEYNGIALATKHEVKKALKRADNLGDVIDKLIKALDETNFNYLEYCALKAEIIKTRLEMDYIIAEIEEELKLDN
ncbi:MAG TPA: hypothetical protein VIK72_16205 [Clostridiaceae bacterium]